MESLLLPCTSGLPFAIACKQEIPSEIFLNPIKTSFSKTNPVITDTHLSFLCKNGRLSEAVNALDAIAKRGAKVRPNTYIQLLQSCIDSDCIQLGRKVHARIDLVDQVDLFVETKLVGMYAKCGCLKNARKVFDEMRERNLYTWSAMIGACSREQRWNEVVKLFYMMMVDGFVPDGFLFPKILQACGNSGDLRTGKLIHSLVIRSKMDSYERVSNSILAVYAKCGELELATIFFDNMIVRDKVAWNSMLSGYCHLGKLEKARKLFEQMQTEGIERSLVTWNIMISSYCQAGNCDIALELMNEMEILGIKPDVFTWTSMISGLTQHNRTIRALELFRDMVLAGVEPSGVTITSVISACASLKSLSKGKEVHSLAFRYGLMRDILVRNSLVDMYSKSGKLESAKMVFDMILEKDVFTLNSMIGGYFQAGYCGKAYDLFMTMQESDVQPNAVTWNVMISGYMQNGDEDQAMDLVRTMDQEGIERDTATWNSLISGYAQNELKDKALAIFRQMQVSTVKPNSVTILCILPSCANLIAANKVKEIHGCVLRANLDSEVSIANALIDAYAKSGRLIYSKLLFDGLSLKDIISWNSLIGGYILHGCSFAALDLYNEMKRVGFKPNRGTFVRIIFAYSLARMVDEGKMVFSNMIDEYEIVPGLDYNLAMIDLFGRSGRLEEAFEFIENMTIETESSIWESLLTACRIHGNKELAIRAGARLLELEPGNIMINQSMFDTFRDFTKKKNPEKITEIKKLIGQSWIEINNKVHCFTSGDCSKPYSDFLYTWVRNIEEKMKPHDSYRGLAIEDEDEEMIVGVHSEKLALAFMLISSKRTPKSIRIVKNIRMCTDCHMMGKFVSIMYGCEIYIKDSKCFHHFKNGVCSCGEYW